MTGTQYDAIFKAVHARLKAQPAAARHDFRVCGVCRKHVCVTHHKH